MLFISTYNNYNYISTYLCQPLIAALLMLINTFAFIIKNNYLFYFTVTSLKNQTKNNLKKSVPLTYLTKIYLIRNLLGQANGYIS